MDSGNEERNQGAQVGAPPAGAVRRALEGVLDPELGASIVELGMVHDIEVTPDAEVTVHVALTTAACPLRGHIGAEVRSRVLTLAGAREVRVEYAEMSQTERSALMERARLAASLRAPDTAVPARTRVIAVASGKGGVGKSSVTANMAAALASLGHTVGVLDSDIWGFSIPRMLGVDGRLAGERSGDGKGRILPHERVVARYAARPMTGSAPAQGFHLAAKDPPSGRAGSAPAQRFDSAACPTHGLRPDSARPAEPSSGVSHDGLLRVVSMGLLVDDEQTALMWRGPVLAKALEQFLCDVTWGDLDYLLLDMPPGTGDIQMALSRLLPRVELLLVTTPALAAQHVAARVADMARRSHLHVLGIVENMSEFVAPDGSRHAIFGTGGGRRLASTTGTPLLGRVPIEPAVSAGGDAGTPVVLDDPAGAAAESFRSIAELIATEMLPPVEIMGCTARMLASVAR